MPALLSKSLYVTLVLTITNILKIRVNNRVEKKWNRSSTTWKSLALSAWMASITTFVQDVWNHEDSVNSIRPTINRQKNKNIPGNAAHLLLLLVRTEHRYGRPSVWLYFTPPCSSVTSTKYAASENKFAYNSDIIRRRTITPVNCPHRADLLSHWLSLRITRGTPREIFSFFFFLALLFWSLFPLTQATLWQKHSSHSGVCEQEA